MGKKLFPLAALLFVLLCSGCSSTSGTAENLRQTEITEISFRMLDSQGNLTFLEELDPALHDAFILDFLSLPCDTYWNDPMEEIISGPFIHILFADGTYYSVNNYCTVYFDGSQTKDLRECYTREVFQPFWEKYCDSKFEFTE